MEITRSKGGTNEREVDVNNIEVPDCWHLAMWLQREGHHQDAEMVLETWGLAHDLLTTMKDRGLRLVKISKDRNQR